MASHISGTCVQVMVLLLIEGFAGCRQTSGFKRDTNSVIQDDVRSSGSRLDVYLWPWEEQAS